MTAKRGRGKPVIAAPDILILHGMSKPLVDFFTTFFESLGVSSASAMDLPAGGRPQEEKVDYYIRNCRFPLVLLTFNEKAKRSTTARPNVYDEIARCRNLGKKRETIILQQVEGRRIAELPSNVTGQMVVIQFDTRKLHEMLPMLLRELRSRQVLRKRDAEELTVEAGGRLSEFVDKMDALWEGEFDQAWRRIHRLDYAAESNFADTLDLFFQQYHKVFSALVHDKKYGDELKIVCDAAYTEALNCVARAWEYVAESKMRSADGMSSNPAYAQGHRKYRRMYDRGAEVLRQGKSTRQPERQVVHFRKAIELLDDYMAKL